MLFKKASHKKRQSILLKYDQFLHGETYRSVHGNIHAGKKMIPGEASLVDPDVLPADHTGNICLQEDNYIDQDQNSGGRVQITTDIAVIISETSSVISLSVYGSISSYPFCFFYCSHKEQKGQMD